MPGIKVYSDETDVLTVEYDTNSYLPEMIAVVLSNFTERVFPVVKVIKNGKNPREFIIRRDDAIYHRALCWCWNAKTGSDTTLNNINYIITR